MAAYEGARQTEEGSTVFYTPISDSRLILPYWSPYSKDGLPTSKNNGTWTGIGQDPIEWMANDPVHYRKYKVLPTVFANTTPIESLTIRAQFGTNCFHSTAFTQSYPSYVINNSTGSAGCSPSNVLTLSEMTTANYRWGLNENHSLNFLLRQGAMNFEPIDPQVVSRG